MTNMNQTMLFGRRHVRVILYLQYNLIQPWPKPRAAQSECGHARLCSHDKWVDFYINCWHAVIKFWCLSWPEVRAKMHLVLYGGRWRTVNIMNMNIAKLSFTLDVADFHMWLTVAGLTDWLFKSPLSKWQIHYFVYELILFYCFAMFL